MGYINPGESAGSRGDSVNTLSDLINYSVRVKPFGKHMVYYYN